MTVWRLWVELTGLLLRGRGSDEVYLMHLDSGCESFDWPLSEVSAPPRREDFVVMLGERSHGGR